MKSYYKQIKPLLEKESLNMSVLVDEGEYWEAFDRLNLLLLYCSSVIQAEEWISNKGETPYTIHALLEWISNNKGLIDEIVRGIGGEDYGISTSLYGMKLSVSFPSGNNSSISGGIST